MVTEHAYRFVSSSHQATKQCAASLAAHLKPGHVLVLTGDLGAGKTQFAQGLAAALGIRTAVVSPTFNIVITYDDGVLPLSHFDLYRLDAATELEDIGFYDYAEGDGVMLVEWGDKFPECLPESYIELRFRVEADATRIITVTAVGDEGRHLLDVWTRDERSQMTKAES